ncbi:calcium-independent phospholipase A2-gamma-like [Saccostrea echinata]|uniref:calcium-independent phospholipase A2-gamma-like n=1 Tax=Saccostrea echinata TaxID=191078 RepID=UPI002A8054B6|nr:calcium-independent phospholipase A2-gamma-like [Saccostrea echinata]
MSVLRASCSGPKLFENTLGGPLSIKCLHQNVETSQTFSQRTTNPETVKKFHFGQTQNKKEDILHRIGITSAFTDRLKDAYGDVSSRILKTPSIVKDYLDKAPSLSIKGKFQKKKTFTFPEENDNVVASKDFSSQIEESSVLSFYDPTAETESKYRPVKLTRTELEQNLSENASIPKSQAEDKGLRHLLDRFWATTAKDPTTQEEVKKKVIVRKDYVSRSTISRKTLEHVKLISRAESSDSKLKRLEDFCHHLILYPDERQTALKHGLLPVLLRMQITTSSELAQSEISQALTLMGHVHPPRGQGVNILTIDGGGTKGLVALQTLREMERHCGKPIYKLFDYVCGVSTGSLILAILFLFRRSITECEELYLECSRQMFTQNKTRGYSQLVLDHSFYDVELWERILKEKMGEKFLSDFSEDPLCPKYSALSTLSNISRLQSYMFRTYNLPPGVYSMYPGSCKHRVWECIRASSAAPGFYKPFILDEYIHQDGGIMHNNPTAVALHECKLLWPDEPIQCVISLGNGRYEPNLELMSSLPSARKQIDNIIDSATNTESVHMTLQDLLPPATYYRFNPYMSDNLMLNEIKPEKIKQMQKDARMYLRKNEHKIVTACNQLMLPRRTTQRLSDWSKRQKLMRAHKKPVIG